MEWNHEKLDTSPWIKWNLDDHKSTLWEEAFGYKWVYRIKDNYDGRDLKYD